MRVLITLLCGKHAEAETMVKILQYWEACGAAYFFVQPLQSLELLLLFFQYALELVQLLIQVK